MFAHVVDHSCAVGKMCFSIRLLGYQVYFKPVGSNVYIYIYIPSLYTEIYILHKTKKNSFYFRFKSQINVFTVISVKFYTTMPKNKKNLLSTLLKYEIVAYRHYKHGHHVDWLVLVKRCWHNGRSKQTVGGFWTFSKHARMCVD